MSTTTESKDLIKTPYYDFHVAAGAKMVPFAGFNMPIQYDGSTPLTAGGMIAEHNAVRNNVGLFDLSHMGEFEVSGPGALDFLMKTTVNNVFKMSVGQCQYNCMCMPDGGIVDDLLVYRLPTRYMLVVNASNIEKDFNWLKQFEHEFDVRLSDKSAETSLLAIQGLNAQKVLSQITDYDLDSISYYHWALGEIAGVELLFSRTGYTGEDGFELYIAPEHAEKLWHAIAKAGQKYDMKLIGLGARDSLRLEMKMALYGNDIDETTSPIEAGLGWIVDFDKGDFVGRDVLLKQKEEKPKRRLVCLELEGKAFPRPGYDIYSGNDIVGKVTSGTFSPSIQKPIALGYVPIKLSAVSSTVEVDNRGKKFPATVVKPPFYKKASHK
ncbi:MAG TPA: glycine cleavage system aminomethyltransferase GcvT [candidate division Zixibacteria bacterium]|nr:glycine cleavage system aminomethyltransferase GcvT [candidate division Zixibacteria bacterium]